MSKFIGIVSESKSLRVMTPPKLTVELLLGLTRAHLVIRMRFYGRLKFLPVFVVLILPFLVQILKRMAQAET